jgi:hypothetical protein
MARLLWLGLVLVACSSSGGKPARLADGGYRLSCRGPLSDCLKGADKVCREQGYTVAVARDKRELLGHEQGQSQVEVRRSEATIYCGSSPLPASAPPPEPASPAPPVLAPAPVPAPPPARACTPGASQACVGPGGCPGGQTCSADGTHFETCDCGPTN